jgi:hypothetical protein
MALSDATRLADFATGIGTLGAVLKVDNLNKKVGIGTTNPSAMLSVGPGDAILMDGDAGVITATSFVGSGADLTGVSGFGTAVNSTTGTLGNLVYKTPRSFYVGGGASALLESDTTSGGMLFTRLAEIHIGSASTVHIGSGTTVAMDVLNIF